METQNLTTEHFLVYGTLRPGCGSYDYYFPNVAHSVQTVRIPGFAMFGAQSFPYAVRTDDMDSIECTLITVTDTPDNVRSLMKELDHLEGYNPESALNHYERITVEVNGVNAHLYVASDTTWEQHVANLPRLDSGNWHEVSPPQDGAFMWIYIGEDESIIPDSSVEPRFVMLDSDYEEEEEEEGIYESDAYADVETQAAY